MKKAIQAIRSVGAKYQHKDVLVVMERGPNALRLVKLMDKAFDGEFPYEVVTMDKFGSADKPMYFICGECAGRCKTLKGLKSHYRGKHKDVKFPKTPRAVLMRVSTKEKMERLQKYLKENPKEILMLQRTDSKVFIKGQQDIRPLQYLSKDA